MKFALIRLAPFQNNPKDLDPSYKTDQDFGIFLEGKKSSSYNRRNTVISACGSLNCCMPCVYLTVTFLQQLSFNNFIQYCKQQLYKLLSVQIVMCLLTYIIILYNMLCKHVETRKDML